MLPTEPIGSLPRSLELTRAFATHKYDGKVPEDIERLYRNAVKEAVIDLENTGSPVITDGEQSKPSYFTYPMAGSLNIEPDGVVAQFTDGHGRRLPRLCSGPFSYMRYAGEYVVEARKYATRPIKQAIISPASVFLIYPKSGVDGYNTEEFLYDIIGQAELDLRSCLGQSCCNLQIDFPEAALSVRIDPSGELLQKFIVLNNLLLDRFSPSQKACIGVHVCPGYDQGSSFCSEDQYVQVLRQIFNLHTDCFYLALQKFDNKDRILSEIRRFMRPTDKLFMGVVDVSPSASLADSKDIQRRIEHIARYIPLRQLGTTDDCGFAPYADGQDQDRQFALKAIKARVTGTSLF